MQKLSLLSLACLTAMISNTLPSRADPLVSLEMLNRLLPRPFVRPPPHRRFDRSADIPQFVLWSNDPARSVYCWSNPAQASPLPNCPAGIDRLGLRPGSSWVYGSYRSDPIR